MSGSVISIAVTSIRGIMTPRTWVAPMAKMLASISFFWSAIVAAVESAMMARISSSRERLGKGAARRGEAQEAHQGVRHPRGHPGERREGPEREHGSATGAVRVTFSELVAAMIFGVSSQKMRTTRVRTTEAAMLKVSTRS